MKGVCRFLFSFFLSSLAALTIAGDDDVSLKGETTAKYKYVEFNEFGRPEEVLLIKEENPRALKDGEIRVKVLASPINPSNLYQITGNYGSPPEFPATPGSEGVGRVIEISESVRHIKIGQLVLLVGGGTWREQIVASASQFLPLPEFENLDDKLIEQLSMSIVNPVTAFLMLNSFKQLKEGQWLVQSAANSAVGGYVIQLARQRGIKTVNVVRRSGLADDLIAKGGDVVLIDGPDLAAKIKRATDDAPIQLALDAVGGDTFGRLANSLNNDGTLIAYGVLSGRPANLNTAITIFKDIRIRGFWLAKWYEKASGKEKKEVFDQIIPLVASGSLTADIDSRFTINEIKQAVLRAARPGRNGKVLLVSGGDGLVE